MYNHLLVPVDGSDLSIQIIGQAVEFARTLGARITFSRGAGPCCVAAQRDRGGLGDRVERR